jgi:hypothetical protein
MPPPLVTRPEEKWNHPICPEAMLPDTTDPSARSPDPIEPDVIDAACIVPEAK